MIKKPSFLGVILRGGEMLVDDRLMVSGQRAFGGGGAKSRGDWVECRVQKEFMGFCWNVATGLTRGMRVA